jgi:cyanophycin synthetase
VWFSAVPDHPVVHTHMRDGGRAYLLADGWLVEADGDRWRPLLAVEDLPGAFGGAARYAVLNALAAAAAADALGVPTDTIVAGLRDLRPADLNPGRGMLFERDGVHLLVDYAHNPAAIAAVSEVLHRVWGADRTVAVVTLPGDRRDDLLRESARAVAERFERVVLYEDTDRRGRAAGEVPALVGTEICALRPSAACVVVRTVEEALPAALALARPGDVVLLLYEKIEPVLALLSLLGAQPETGVTETRVELMV